MFFTSCLLKTFLRYNCHLKKIIIIYAVYIYVV